MKVVVLHQMQQSINVPVAGSVTAQFSPITGCTSVGQAARTDHTNLYVQLSFADSNSGNVFCEKSQTGTVYKYEKIKNFTFNSKLSNHVEEVTSCPPFTV